MPILEMYDPDDPEYEGLEGNAFYHEMWGKADRIEFPSKDVYYEKMGIIQTPEMSLAHELGHHKAGVIPRQLNPLTESRLIIDEELDAWEEVMRWKIPVGHWGSNERRQAAGLLGEYYRYKDRSINRKRALKALYGRETKVRRELDL